MVSPTQFGFNEQAFESNRFQVKPSVDEMPYLQEKALHEFEVFVQSLRNLGVEVIVFEDSSDSKSPDSIFPNNWISTHRRGEMIVYPMAVPNRKEEKRKDILDYLISRYHYSLTDLSLSEKKGSSQFLEGTGSMIFDHNNKVVYAAISPRTDEALFRQVAKNLGYKAISFEAYGKEGELIYHTNVMMSVGESFIITCMECVDNKDRELLSQELNKSGKIIIDLSTEQVHEHFAGNMLQINNMLGESILVMSQNAKNSLSEAQLERLNEMNDHILAVSIPTIEKIGGGSARCMLAEVFEVGELDC